MQVSYEFADLHDRPGRMVAKGVIRDCVPWAKARGNFYWRVRRRLAQDALVKQLKESDASLTHAAGVEMLKGWCDVDWEDDQAVLSFFESGAVKIEAGISEYKTEAVGKTVAELLAGLSDEAKAKLIASLS